MCYNRGVFAKPITTVTIHALHGYIACGKTTYAKKLEAAGAVRFTIDEWVARLYGATPVDIKECNAKVRELIYEVSATLVARGVDVVWDLGYWKRVDRDAARARAAAMGAKIVWYNFVCDDAVALKRCLARTVAEQPLEINEEAYWGLKKYFEPMGGDEDGILVVSGCLPRFH